MSLQIRRFHPKLIILHILCVHFWCVCMSVCVRVAYVVYVCVLCIISPLKIHVRTKEARADRAYKLRSIQVQVHACTQEHTHTTHTHIAGSRVGRVVWIFVLFGQGAFSLRCEPRMTAFLPTPLFIVERYCVVCCEWCMHVEYLEHSHAEASVVQRGARSIWVQRSAALWISSLS